MLYAAMEDFRLDIMLGQGTAARTMRIELPFFTLIGATTRSGLLSNPLRDRFIANLHFDFYESNDLERIIKNNIPKLHLNVADEAIKFLAKSSRGTPRIANRILHRVRDYALSFNHKLITKEEVFEALKLMEIDDAGLDRMDRKILRIIEDFYSCGPVGIEAIAATLSEDKGTIEDVYEPYLLKEGFLLRTSRGRVLSEKGREHLKKNS
jgi:Holliday junction DNA helicase RuvB